MTLKRIVLAVALAVGLAMTISAQTAEVRFLYGEPYDSAEHPISKGDNKVVVRHLQRELMTDHRCVGENLFLTAYADGSRTICNYNEKAVVWEGKSIAPVSYILINPDGSIFTPKPF